MAPSTFNMPTTCLIAASRSCKAAVPELPESSPKSLAESMGTGTSPASSRAGAGLGACLGAGSQGLRHNLQDCLRSLS